MYFCAMKSARIPLIPLILLLLMYSCKQKGTEGTANEKESIYNKPPFGKLTAAIADNPSAANYYSRGLALHRASEDSLALLDLKKAVSLDSTKAVYYSSIGDILFEHKDVSGSVSWLSKALALDPNDVKAHLKLAKVMLFTKEYPKAFEQINTVLRQDAYNPEGYFLKGVIYKDMKDTDRAISSFQTAINVAPDYREAMIQLGLIYARKGDPQGLKYLDNAYHLDSNDVFPLYAKGMYYQERAQYEPAKEEYHRCILRNREYTDAYFNTGWILLQQDSLEKARRQFDLVTKIDPANASAYYNRGLCSELMNDKTEAANDYRQALTFDKDYKEALAGLKRVGG